jgi:hypothetical protein
VVRAPLALVVVLLAADLAALVIGLGALASQRDAIALFGFTLGAPLLAAVGTLAEGARG